MNERYIVKQATEQDIRDMYDRSEWTWEGMSDDEDNLNQIADFLEINVPKLAQPYTFWIWQGDMFNDMYGLTGRNAYPDDLTFVAVDDLYEPFLKIQYGARWLDDIVDNNLEREQ